MSPEKRLAAQHLREAALQQHERCEQLTAELQPAKRGKGRPKKIPEAAEAEQNARELEGEALQLDSQADDEERKVGQPSGKRHRRPTQRAADRDDCGEAAEGERGEESSSASESSVEEDDDEEARVTKTNKKQVCALGK